MRFTSKTPVRTFVPLTVAVAALVTSSFAQAQTATPPEETEPGPPPLTPTQMESVTKQLRLLKETLKNRNLAKNGSAERIFRDAAASPKAALELYLKCYKEINFERLEKDASDYREWEAANQERLDFKPFQEALQLQLHYLALSTRAAQRDDVSSIFNELTAFIDRIASMNDPNHPALDTNVASTVFANVYELDAALGRNADKWELNPINIGGIYNKTIMPHLRENDPDNLEAAWAQRIANEKRIADFYVDMEDDMERYQRRNEDEDQAVRQQVNQIATYTLRRARGAHLFEEETFPALMWGRYRDMFQYGDSADATAAMLNLIGANIGHDAAAGWISELQTLTGVTLEEDESGETTPQTTAL